MDVGFNLIPLGHHPNILHHWQARADYKGDCIVIVDDLQEWGDGRWDVDLGNFANQCLVQLRKQASQLPPGSDDIMEYRSMTERGGVMYIFRASPKKEKKFMYMTAWSLQYELGGMT